VARILLVEDDPHLAALYLEVLGARGHEITLATNGQEALDRIAAAAPDLVLMDLQMPVMDGLEAAERLKASEHGHIPIIALTNLQLPEEISAALDAGCDGYLAKPVDPTDLADELGAVLDPGVGDESGGEE
jgi:CheY-like chemotaxis protein